MAQRPIKRVSNTGQLKDFNASSDVVAAAGLDLEDLGTHTILRNSNNMELTDPTVGTLTLDQLRSTARVSANDTTPNFLEQKIIGGGDISVATLNDGTDEDLQISYTAPPFGKDFSRQIKDADETVTGTTFTEYDSLTFAVTESATNTFRCNIDFYWGHNSGSNDIRARLMVDGAQQGEELRIEPKDAGVDQRIQNNLLRYVDNLSIGNHTLSIEYRPSVGSRISRMYYSTIEVWRVL